MEAAAPAGLLDPDPGKTPQGADAGPQTKGAASTKTTARVPAGVSARRGAHSFFDTWPAPRVGRKAPTLAATPPAPLPKYADLRRRAGDPGQLGSLGSGLVDGGGKRLANIRLQGGLMLLQSALRAREANLWQPSQAALGVRLHLVV
jgi:hypothetical protein